MGRTIAIVSGKGGVGKSLAFDEYVSLPNGSIVQIGPYIDTLIEKNPLAVKKIACKTIDGFEELFEIVEPVEGFELDSFLFSHENQKLVHVQKKPVALMRKPAPTELVKITCPVGSVSVTREHAFIVMRHGKLQKVRAEDIIPKMDYVLLYKTSKDISNAESVPVPIAQWLGFVIGDGHMDEYKVHVFSAPGEMLPIIRQSFMNVFGEYREGVSRNLHGIAYYKQAKVRALYEKYGVKIALSGGKEVPGALFNSNNASITAFLRALFDCDGTVNSSRKEVEYDSKSKKLVFQIASLLRMRFGISSQVKLTFKRATNGRMKEKAPYWRLYITGENAKIFAQLIGFNHHEKAKRLYDNFYNGKKMNTNIEVYPIGKLLKKIRMESGITALELAKDLGCTKQMVYEYEWEYYGLSRQTIQRYLSVYRKKGIDHSLISWLEQLLQGNIEFRRVEKVERNEYDWPYVYDFQVSDYGGHFVHSSGVIVSNTSIVANLGIALAKRGISVCLVDADIAMANLSLLLGMQSSPITLHDVLLGESTIQDAVYDGPAGLKFIPSGLSLENYRRVDSDRLTSIIQSIAPKFEFVLLDGPAGIEKTVLATIAACEEVLLVTVPDPPSVADVLKTKIVSQRLGSKPLGVILNFVRGEKGEITKEDISRMLELPVYASIPYDDEMRKSFMREKVAPIILRAPNSPAAKSIYNLAARLAGIPVKEEAIAVQREGFFARLFKIFSRKDSTHAHGSSKNVEELSI